MITGFENRRKNSGRSEIQQIVADYAHIDFYESNPKPDQDLIELMQEEEARIRGNN